ncbi:MAG: DUF2182 domain-containing protein [Armatimonadetes bacterium]|nr:DUF2182 domain-containing protein [Armatimonadota bacterium]
MVESLPDGVPGQRGGHAHTAGGFPSPLERERNLILAVLLGLAGAAWVSLIRQSAEAGAPMMGPAMGMGAAPFVGLWVLMMVAMMFPAAAPMILTYARVHAGKRQHGQAFVPTWVFVGAYLVIWTLFGVLAYGAAAMVEAQARHSYWLMNHAARIGGGLLVLAGLYQLSPLKHSCLSKCRSPLHFILTSWREGYGGAFRMGLEHGVYCLGCCWLLFLVLLPLGVMNIAAMVTVAALIFAEKSLPAGERISRWAAGALIAYGLAAILVPGVLPTVLGHQM